MKISPYEVVQHYIQTYNQTVYTVEAPYVTVFNNSSSMHGPCENRIV